MLTICSTSRCLRGRFEHLLTYLGGVGRQARTKVSGTRNVRCPQYCSQCVSRYRLTISLGFVNAQYRFVMNPTGDYTVHFADPDMCVFVMHYRASHSNVRNSFFQWHDILQVIIPRTSALASAASSGESELDEGNTSCPICLSSPTAPRMTKCGHVSLTEISL